MNNKQMAFAGVWNKYLPAIKILLKKAVLADQVLGMNRTDFERASGIKKSGYRFVISFTKDRPNALFSGNDFVQAFIGVLQDDTIARALLTENNYTFSFNSKYQLQIKNNSLQNRASLPEPAEEIAVS
jgi:hypothetical protein